MTNQPSRTVVGIDPGKYGAIACFKGGDPGVAPMPAEGGGKDRHLLPYAIARLITAIAPEIICIERQSCRPRENSARVLETGTNYGILIGIAAGLDIPVAIITPQVWKAALFPGTSIRDKAAAIALAHALYPEVSLRPTPRSRVDSDGMADALCIAHYAKTYLGKF